MFLSFFRKITVYISRFHSLLVRGGVSTARSRPIRTFVVQGRLACSITRDEISEPSVRILHAMCLHCQQCKCVFYLLVDSEKDENQISAAVCPDCASPELTSFELL